MKFGRIKSIRSKKRRHLRMKSEFRKDYERRMKQIDRSWRKLHLRLLEIERRIASKHKAEAA